MQYTDPGKACYLYINSTGCTRADGEVVGFETEATAIYDTMKYIGNEVSCLIFYYFNLIICHLGIYSWDWSSYRSGMRSPVCRTKRKTLHDSTRHCDASPTKSSINRATADY